MKMVEISEPSRGTPAWLILQRTAYPVTVGTVLLTHLWIKTTGGALLFATLMPAALAALLVTMLELCLPYRREWKPKKGEISEDLTYMVLVQMFLPRALGFLVALVLLRTLPGNFLPDIWPSHWHVVAQVVLMIFLADFFRYWFHVASHKIPFFWRFHAVHHSPHSLYWLNVGRFHPVEKSFQFLLDAFPFLLLGVSEDVLALYFVFYAVNGFFQHSNVAVRLGPLNYIISGPELHRWHHSVLQDESNANYGNNVIVWDLLFGTWFLPNDRQVGSLGLLNRMYPSSFGKQLRTPWIKGLEKTAGEVPAWKDSAINVLMRFRMAWAGTRNWKPLAQAARHPKKAQERVLQRTLRLARDTRFGREHRFREIQSYGDFKDRVPVADYENLRPYIEEQEHTGEKALFSSNAVLYNLTSGTAGKPKLIPLTKGVVRRHKNLQRIHTYHLFRRHPDAFGGKILGIVSPAVEGHLDSGTPFGSSSGLLYQSIPRLARSKYVLPPEVFSVGEYELRYLLIARLAAAEPAVTLVGCANPSTLLRVAQVLRENAPALLEDIAAGHFHRMADLPESVQRAVGPRLAIGNRNRAERIQAALDRSGQALFHALWPRLRLVNTWTGGSCGIALTEVRKLLPDTAIVADLGYISSEFRGTVTIDAESGAGLPTLLDNFFEFVERNDWESRRGPFLTLDRISYEHDYYVFVTNESGLYRYAMNDIVRVTGRFKNTPTIEFVQKGKGVTNITGEKLYESQVLAAMEIATHQRNVSSPFFLMVADVHASRYKLYLETPLNLPGFEVALTATLEGLLSDANLEYREKRRSGRLGPLEVRHLRPGTQEAFRRFMVGKGQREGQFKFVALQYAADLDFPMDRYVIQRPATES